MATLRQLVAASLAVLALASPAPGVGAEHGMALVDRLRAGGHVLYFRHAATDWSSPDRLSSETGIRSCDGAAMRQLSDAGRASARRVGEAMRALRIPVQTVRASPYCRTRETAELLGVGPVSTTPDLMNTRTAGLAGGREALKRRARELMGALPERGNTVLVAHGNVFLLAAGGRRPPEGGAVVLQPLGDGEFREIGRLPADDWHRLAAERTDAPATAGEQP